MFTAIDIAPDTMKFTSFNCELLCYRYQWLRLFCETRTFFFEYGPISLLEIICSLGLPAFREVVAGRKQERTHELIWKIKNNLFLSIGGLTASH